jgi:hypothetical protein
VSQSVLVVLCCVFVDGPGQTLRAVKKKHLSRLKKVDLAMKLHFQSPNEVFCAFSSALVVEIVTSSLR